MMLLQNCQTMMRHSPIYQWTTLRLLTSQGKRVTLMVLIPVMMQRQRGWIVKVCFHHVVLAYYPHHRLPHFSAAVMSISPNSLFSIEKDFVDLHLGVVAHHKSHPVITLDCFQLFITKVVVKSQCAWTSSI